MRINNNLMAMNTHRQLGLSNAMGAKSMSKLSSGFRINSAADDAAGLSISEKMRAQIRGLGQASRNAQDGISLIQTAEGALGETQAILQRMRELATQASTDTNTATDRGEIQKEIDQLAGEITRISNTTEFNTQNLAGGNLNVKFHVGANEGQNIGLSVLAMDAFSLNVAGNSSTAAVTGTGDVTAATVTGTAAAVVDGNVVTATTTEVAGAAATSGSLTASYVGANGNLELTIDGTAVTVALLEGDSAAEAVTKINDAIGATALPGGSYAVADDGNITISSLTTGTTSSVAVTGALAGFTVASDTGEAAGATTYTLTLAGTTGADSVITGLAVDATTASGTEDFAGFALTLDGALADGQVSTITLSVSSGSAATFNADGTINTNAVATTGIDVSTQAAADTAISTINDAIESVSAERSKLGAMQNRLEHTIKNLDTSSENLQASESRIRDVDMAKEMMEFTKQNILQQAATAMLAQANQAPQGVLQLLR